MSNLEDEKINQEFCKEVGIKKACCYLQNRDTGEIRYYSNLSGLYKNPKNWKNIIRKKIEPCYPDIINDYKNFSLVINTHWDLFGELGEAYYRTGLESFEANYLKTRIRAMKMCKSLGGGDMLEEYKKSIRELPLNYTTEVLHS